MPISDLMIFHTDLNPDFYTISYTISYTFFYTMPWLRAAITFDTFDA
jgi:hypothetical protein